LELDVEQMNTVMPPAGEAGMCRADGDWFQYFDGKWFYNGSRLPLSGARDAWHFFKCGDRGHVSSWRWATISELTAAGISEDEARKMVHKSMLPDAPWYPPQQAGFGPWIERTSAACQCPVPLDARILWLTKGERRARRFERVESTARDRAWTTEVVAYCIKLEDKPRAAACVGNTVTGAAEPLAVPYVKRGLWADPNAAMILRDGPPAAKPAPATPAPGFMLPGFRSDEPGLLVVAGFDHRPGLWR
jgi:hypothetical protein